MAEETEKSKVSILPGGVQVKATIDNFYKFIADHYGDKLRQIGRAHV